MIRTRVTARRRQIAPQRFSRRSLSRPSRHLLLRLRAVRMVALRLHRRREELRDPDEDDSDDRSTTSISGSVKPSCAAAARRTCSRAHPLTAHPRQRPTRHQAMRRSSVGRSACPSWTAGSSGSASFAGSSLSSTSCFLSAWSSAMMKSWRFGAAAAATSLSTSPLDHEIDQRRRQRLHVEELTVRDCLGDRLRLVLADQIGDPGVVDHHLERGDAAAVCARQEPLADDALAARRRGSSAPAAA